MRIHVLDGLRGFFLLFMMIIHLNFFGSVVGKVNHHYFGWVEDAQGFVFISGVVVGIVYGAALLKHDPAEMARRIRKRITTIYSHQAGLILIFLAAALTLARLGYVAPVLAPYVAEPVAFTVSSLMLFSASIHMGILPMYILFMIATPLALRAFESGRAPVVLAISLFLWATAQTGLVEWATDLAEEAVRGLGVEVQFGVFFNLFGWQVIYFLGLFLGFRHVSGDLNLRFLEERAGEATFYVCLAMAFLLGVFDRVVYADDVAIVLSERVLASADRSDFSYLHLIAFLIDLYCVAWLLRAGPTASTAFARLLGRIFVAVFTFRPLVFLGQHSLHVFSFHLLVVYTAMIALPGKQLAEPYAGALLIVGALSLYLAALAHRSMQRANQPPRKLARARV